MSACDALGGSGLCFTRRGEDPREPMADGLLQGAVGGMFGHAAPLLTPRRGADTMGMRLAAVLVTNAPE